MSKPIEIEVWEEDAEKEMKRVLEFFRKACPRLDFYVTKLLIHDLYNVYLISDQRLGENGVQKCFEVIEYKIERGAILKHVYNPYEVELLLEFYSKLHPPTPPPAPTRNPFSSSTTCPFVAPPPPPQYTLPSPSSTNPFLMTTTPVSKPKAKAKPKAQRIEVPFYPDRENLPDPVPWNDAADTLVQIIRAERPDVHYYSDGYLITNNNLVQLVKHNVFFLTIKKLSDEELLRVIKIILQHSKGIKPVYRNEEIRFILMNDRMP